MQKQGEEPDVYIVSDGEDDGYEGQLSVPLPPPDEAMLKEYGYESFVPETAEVGGSTPTTRAITHNRCGTPIPPVVSIYKFWENFHNS